MNNLILRRRMMMEAQSGSVGGEIEVPNGVYIQDTDGVLWQNDAWDRTATPNGIAVVTDECRFVIALKESSTILIDRDGYSSNMSLTIYSSGFEAITDFSGARNTTEMIYAYYNDKYEAAGYCANFTFPNGKKGHLGSAGEWEAAYVNKYNVVNCMSTVFGTAIRNGIYWTSTRGQDSPYDPEYDVGPFNTFWYFYWSDGAMYYTEAHYSPYVIYARPFTELGEVTGIVEA